MSLVSAEEVAQFHEQGFLRARPLLSSVELEPLRDAFENLKEGRSSKKPELSRNLSGDRTIDQEIRLSANYLRDSLNVETFASCYVAGDGAPAIQATLAEEFQSQVRPVSLRDYAEDIPAGLTGMDAELTACTGVFTG